VRGPSGTHHCRDRSYDKIVTNMEPNCHTESRFLQDLAADDAAPQTSPGNLGLTMGKGLEKGLKKSDGRTHGKTKLELHSGRRKTPHF